ncbi:MAG: protein kinase [Sandaracinus sp.]|nr:protein kinase [Sandaracinus sp.]MCB9624149.1 protein kinase [Sandaracinus sp.]MCB9636526.1 protein kinase [Sandaracinus sp.]
MSEPDAPSDEQRTLDDDDDPWAPEPTEVVDPFSPGFFFGDRFRIDAPLGTGAMGAVYRATDLRTQQPVALKVLLQNKQDGEGRQRFAREAQILSDLDHPGVVGIRGFGHAKSVPWLAMELVEGETLGQRIRRAGKLEPSVLTPILRDLCSALGVAHAAGITHRDLKPDHVMLPKTDTDRSLVKLIDFGLSRASTSGKLTRTGTVLGTPRYMAPEQISSAANASARSDVYALGVIVFEALTGDSPFAASDQGQLLGAILQGRTDSLQKHRPDLPHELDDVIQCAMATRPEDRYGTPRELYDAFVAASGTQGAPRFSTPAPPPPGSFTPARPQAAPSAMTPSAGAFTPTGLANGPATPGRVLVFALLGVGVLLLGAVVGYLLSR